jgi:hypothetical protein
MPSVYIGATGCTNFFFRCQILCLCSGDQNMFFLYMWCRPHCKDTIPKIRNKYSQKRNCAATVPIPTFRFLWAIYIFPWSVCLFCCRKIGGPNVGRNISLVKYGVRSLKFIWAPVYSCTHWLGPRNSSPPPPRIWAHLRGRYWSAKIDDISL